MLYCAPSEDLALAACGCPVLLHHFSGETETSAGFVGIGTLVFFPFKLSGAREVMQAWAELEGRGQRAGGRGAKGPISMVLAWARPLRSSAWDNSGQCQAGFALQSCLVCKHVI